MRNREFTSLIRRHVLETMPGYTVSGGLLFREPLEYLLRGFCFESSGWDRMGFYVWVFVQPLFVPHEAITFTIGDRVGTIRSDRGGCGWSLAGRSEELVMAEVCHLMHHEGPIVLDRLDSLEALIANAITPETNPYCPYTPEMVAYAAILTGDDEKAHEMFDRLEWTLRDESDRVEWENDLLKRARGVREALRRDRSEAVAILHRWREETAAHLKLTKFLAPIPGPQTAGTG